MISFRPVVDDGVSSRREREEICFSKWVTFVNSGKFFVSWPLRSARATLGPKTPAVGTAIQFSWLARALGFVRRPPIC